MTPDDLLGILTRLDQGDTCYLGHEGEDWHSVTTLGKHANGTYHYRYSWRDTYDRMAPVTYDERTFSDAEALGKFLLDAFGKDTSTRISFKDNSPYGGNNRPRYEGLCACLQQKARTVFVVMQNDKYAASPERKERFIFSSVFRLRRQAEGMMKHLRRDYRNQCYVKEVRLYWEDGQVKMDAEIADNEVLTVVQIALSIMDQPPRQFFGD